MSAVRALVALSLTAVAVLLGPAVAPARASAPAAAPTVAFHDAGGLTVRSVTQRSDREYRLVVATPALSAPVRVDVMLPTGYASSAARFPVMYLFHGTGGGAYDFASGGVEANATAAARMIVISPDAGYANDGGGWFTDWVDQTTAKGQSDWETFHTQQLVAWVDANLRTVADRSGRAVAGVSQGGYGAMAYASRHPDLYVAVGSFSGAPEIFADPRARVAANALIGGLVAGLDHVEPFAPFGDPATHAMNWYGHNPGSLVTNLVATDVNVWAGDGTPGPLDSPTDPELAGYMALETIVSQSTQYFLDEAAAAGLPVHDHRYGHGTHNWPYAIRDLDEWVPVVQQVFDEHRAAPTVVGYRSTDASWQAWGWRYAAGTSAQAWSALSQADVHGFTFTGAAGRITTAPLYAPRSQHWVAWSDGTRAVRATADRTGRLTVAVPAAATAVTARVH